MLIEAEMLKALGDTVRLRLAALLAGGGEVCVCRLAAAVGQADFKVSKHLGVLRAAGMLERRRQGTWVYYQLREPVTVFEKALWSGLRVGLGHTLELEQDRRRLEVAECTLVAAPKVLKPKAVAAAKG